MSDRTSNFTAKKVAVCLRAYRNRRNQKHLIRVAEELIEAIQFYAPTYKGNSRTVWTDNGYRANSAMTKLRSLGINLEPPNG